jgi:hypothetical protein
MGCFDIYKSLNVFYLAILMIFATAATKIMLRLMYTIYADIGNFVKNEHRYYVPVGDW